LSPLRLGFLSHVHGPDRPKSTTLAEVRRGELAVARAVVHAVLSAEPVDTAFGHFASYRELYPVATGG
jgi:putative pantetheine hydrolase